MPFPDPVAGVAAATVSSINRETIERARQLTGQLTPSLAVHRRSAVINLFDDAADDRKDVTEIVREGEAENLVLVFSTMLQAEVGASSRKCSSWQPGVLNCATVEWTSASDGTASASVQLSGSIVAVETKTGTVGIFFR
jgi:hypothetical protein